MKLSIYNNTFLPTPGGCIGRFMPRRPAERTPETLFGKNLLRIMERHGLSGKEIAEKTGGFVTGPDITRWTREEGATNPGGSKIKALADAIGVSMDEFYALPEEPSEHDQSLVRFLNSEFADGVTEEERRLLSITKLPYAVPMDNEVWYLVLGAIRRGLKKMGEKK